MTELSHINSIAVLRWYLESVEMSERDLRMVCLSLLSMLEAVQKKLAETDRALAQAEP